MNRCRSTLSIIVAIGGLFCSASAMADAISTDAKQSSNVDVIQLAVSEFIGPEIAALSNDADSQKQSDARASLIAEALLSGENKATPTYLDGYAKAVNDAIDAMLKDPKTSVRARVDAGIVVAKVAEIVTNTQLAPVTITLLSSNLMPVQLWGLRAAEPTILASVQNPLHPDLKPLMTALINTLRVDSPDVLIEEAEISATVKYPSTTLNPPDFQILVPYIQQLVRQRVRNYIQGEPNDPFADSYAVFFLFDSSSIPTQSPAVLKNTMYVTADLLSVIGQRIVHSNTPSNYLQLLDRMSTAMDTSPAAPDVVAIKGITSDSPEDAAAACKTASDTLRADPTWGPLPAAPVVR